MRILAMTDIHGAYDLAREIIRSEPSDVVIIGGDLTTVGSIREAEEAVDSFAEICPRLLCVAGNMDLPAHDELFIKLGVSLNGRGVEIDGVGFFGASAAPHSPLKTPYEISEEELLLRCRRGFAQIRHCPNTVFVPHAPPYGTKVDIIHSGLHVGSTAVREFIEDAHPTLTVCGHIHEARGKDYIEATEIVNCGPAGRGYFAIIELGHGKRSDLFQLHRVH